MAPHATCSAATTIRQLGLDLLARGVDDVPESADALAVDVTGFAVPREVVQRYTVEGHLLLAGVVDRRQLRRVDTCARGDHGRRVGQPGGRARTRAIALRTLVVGECLEP